jgi:hypothetical protein
MAKQTFLSSEEVARLFMDRPSDGNQSDYPDFSGDEDDLDD